MVNIEVSVFHRRSIGPLSCGQALRLDSPGGLTERRKRVYLFGLFGILISSSSLTENDSQRSKICCLLLSLYLVYVAFLSRSSIGEPCLVRRDATLLAAGSAIPLGYLLSI